MGERPKLGTFDTQDVRAMNSHVSSLPLPPSGGGGNLISRGQTDNEQVSHTRACQVFPLTCLIWELKSPLTPQSGGTEYRSRNNHCHPAVMTTAELRYTSAQQASVRTP